MAGNTADNTTLGGFLKKIERAIRPGPTHLGDGSWDSHREVLKQMRQSDPPVYYLVGTPKGRLNRYEEALTNKPWSRVHDGVEVNVAARRRRGLCLGPQSHDRINKERAIVAGS